jgi:hypothetical protein
MLGLARVQRAFADTMTEVSVGYRGGPLNGPGLDGGGGPRSGERVVPVAGQTPVGSGGLPLFALLADRMAATAGLLSRFGGLLDLDARPPFRKGGIWLVRPDGYTVCSTSDPSVIASYLDGIIRGSGITAK